MSRAWPVFVCNPGLGLRKVTFLTREMTQSAAPVPGRRDLSPVLEVTSQRMSCFTPAPRAGGQPPRPSTPPMSSPRQHVDSLLPLVTGKAGLAGTQMRKCTSFTPPLPRNRLRSALGSP